jgi:hypothetical protein
MSAGRVEVAAGTTGTAAWRIEIATGATRTAAGRVDVAAGATGTAGRALRSDLNSCWCSQDRNSSGGLW